MSTWLQVLALVIASLGVAASANWLVHTRTRQLQRIREEADLLDLIPSGTTAYWGLVRRLETEALDYLEDVTNQKRRQARRLMQAGALLFGAAGVILGAAM